ncbi:MAG: helix-turn-helix domain-containing protein [Clostridia bacterium]|nr:helix-turn-helix domain-containing protein [Clostridia bacterium]
MTFAEAIRNARIKAGMTQEELADKIGVSRRTVNSYENGKSWPKNNSRYKQLAKALDVHVSTLTLVEEKYSEITGNNACEEKEKRIAAGLAEFHSLFAGGAASEEDLDRYMQAVQKIYWDLKKTMRKSVPERDANGDAPGKITNGGL